MIFDILNVNFLTATILTKMFKEFALFLMFNRFLICQPNLHDFFDVDVFALIGLIILASLERTEKSTIHQLILDIAMQISILGISALEWALALLLFPLGNAIRAISCLTLGTLQGGKEHLEADQAFEVATIILGGLRRNAMR
jgi:hypothetical protein